MTLPPWVSKVGLTQHFAVGGCSVLLLATLGSPSLAILVTVLAFGTYQEWRDGDFTTAPGAPWNGLLDVGAYIILPLLYLLVQALG